MTDMSGTDGNISGDSPGLEVTGKIMVIAIIFLFFVIVIVCFIHLYAKWFWWSIEQSDTAAHGGAGGRRRRRRFAFAAGQDPTSYGVQRRGLEAQVLRSLPVTVYRSEDFKDGLECAVCLSEVVDGEKARILPKCNHGFHVECIDMWFHSHSTCPICRNLVASSEESSEFNHTSGVRRNASGSYSESSDSESSDSTSEEDLESLNFPTNVLVWGNQTQVNSVGAGPSIQAPSSSSSSSVAPDSSSNNNKRNGMLVIDIPREMNPLSLPSTSRCPEDELKSPMTSRLQSFKRMLSMKFSPRSPSSVDVEQAGKGQS